MRVVAIDINANRNHLLNKLKHVFSMASHTKEPLNEPKPPPPSTTEASRQSTQQWFEVKVPFASTSPLQISTPIYPNYAFEYEAEDSTQSPSRQWLPKPAATVVAITDADMEPTTTETTAISEEMGSTLLPESLMDAETMTTEASGMTKTTELGDVTTVLSLADASSLLQVASNGADVLAGTSFYSN